jgi:hypothetical protein
LLKTSIAARRQFLNGVHVCSIDVYALDAGWHL